MSLVTFSNGDLINASDFNNNFTELNTMITDTNTALSAMSTTFTSIVYNILSVYQDINDLSSSGSIPLEAHKIYRITPTGTVTFVLPTPTTEYVNQFQQILIQVKFGNSVPTVNFGTNYFFDLIKPTFTTNSYYNLVYEYDHKIGDWVCGACRKGSVV